METMAETRCPRCKLAKPLAEFAEDRSKASGRKSHCKACDRTKSREYYAANAAKKAAYHAANREKRISEMKANRDAIRAVAIRIYGGACEWCGSVAELEFDHADDDGAEHRSEESQRPMLRRVASTGERLIDRRLRLLCRSCHRGPGWQEKRAANS